MWPWFDVGKALTLLHKQYASVVRYKKKFPHMVNNKKCAITAFFKFIIYTYIYIYKIYVHTHTHTHARARARARVCNV